MSTEEQSKKDLYYMQRALAEAEAAYKEGEIPVGAVVVCRDRIIARAHNLTETLNDVTAHAEMQAITMAANELGGKYLQDLHAICNCRTLHHVCWCHRLGATSAYCLWLSRRKTGLPRVCTQGFPPKS